MSCVRYEAYKQKIILIPVPCIFIILCNEPTNAKLIDNLLYYSYMFRHYCVIFRELVVSTYSVHKYVNAIVDDTHSDSVHTGPTQRQRQHIRPPYRTS